MSQLFQSRVRRKLVAFTKIKDKKNSTNECIGQLSYNAWFIINFQLRSHYEENVFRRVDYVVLFFNMG